MFDNRELISQVAVTAAQMRDIEARIFAAGMPVAALMEKVAGLITHRIEEIIEQGDKGNFILPPLPHATLLNGGNPRTQVAPLPPLPTLPLPHSPRRNPRRARSQWW